MCINEECIRDILKYLIENLDIIVMNNQYYRYDIISAPDILNDINRYEMKDILYSLKIMNENHFIIGYNLKANDDASNYNNVMIYDVTYYGHKFYESIKPENVWEKTKSIVSKVGNHTLSFVESTAQLIASESAKQAVTIMMTQK